ncbi:hypothetical protein DTW89_10790 [Acidovorax sp. BoFeN1]|uniref:PIN domain-containing protein n=1 Tax=Acidovorax sp. BoFeN1 TaxID=1231053 RepID=UPI000E0971F1|nr:PIN domain-containing protein [Acidovorax sp. BoFeN1]RDD92966.1 hypothetical protein DTW89_10790 [Acidovorax sp. BoFeN1]
MAVPASELARIVQANAPVLCLDTCSVLDVVRDPYRETSQPHDAVAAMDLLQAMESGNRLVGLLADQVHQELATHLPEIEDEARRGLQKLRSHISRVDGLVSALGAPVRTNLSHWDQHVANAASAVRRWIGASTAAPESTAIPNRAYARVMQVRAPARKGKDSLQDCVVLETYLETVAELRQHGLTTTVVFLSSNTNDYGTPTSRSQLQPSLAAEFAAFGMRYASGHGMAKALLGL